MNFDGMTDEDLLETIRNAQREYISRVHPEMGEGVTHVTDALRGAVFYSDNMDETILVRPDCIISINEDGNTSTIEKPEWETGWTC